MLRPILLLSLGLFVLAACAPQSTAAPSAPSNKPLVYVALGASDAVGVGAGGPAESWVADLAHKLPAGSRLVNLGISGEKLQGTLVDELPVAVDAKPLSLIHI